MDDSVLKRNECFQKIHHLEGLNQVFTLSSVNWLIDHSDLWGGLFMEPGGPGLRLYNAPETISAHCKEILPEGVGPFYVLLGKVNGPVPPFRDNINKSRLNIYLQTGNYETIFLNTNTKLRAFDDDVVLLNATRAHRLHTIDATPLVMVSIVLEKSFSELLTCLT
jgi:hypothetical protein